MHYTTRRKLFYLFCAAFLVLGTGAVLFTQGWRLDFHTWQFKKVGGIFVRSFPKDAALLLNGTPLHNDSWFLKNGTFINNLFPTTYTLTLQKEGFRPWKRRITVDPSLVTEISYAVLVPQESKPLLSSSTFLSPQAFTPRVLTLTATSSRFFAEAKDAHTSSTLLITQGTSTPLRLSSSTFSFPFSSPILDLQWNTRGDLGVLEENGTLSAINPLTQTQEKIADDVTGFVWNADGTKLAALEHRSLEIFDFENPSSEYRRFNIPNIRGVEQILWYRDDAHVFIIFPTKTIFLDLNDENLENITEVAPTNQVLYNPSLNTLFYREQITSSTVRVLEFPK